MPQTSIDLSVARHNLLLKIREGAEACRAAQKRYYKTHEQRDLFEARRAETALDRLLRQARQYDETDDLFQQQEPGEETEPCGC